MIQFLCDTWKIPFSVLLFALAFPPWDLSFLVWFALIPGIAVGIQSQSIRHALLLAVWACFWVNLLLFPWIFPALRDYVSLSPIPAVVAWQLFGLICQPQLYALALGLYFLRKVANPFVLSFCIASLYTGIDWISPKIFMDTLGHATHNMESVRQAADLGGAYGITFVIIFHNVALFYLIKSFRTCRNQVGPAICAYGLSALIVCAIFTYGIFRHDQVAKAIAAPERSFGIVGIQANTTGFDKNEAYTSMEKRAGGSESKEELDSFYDRIFGTLIDTHLEMSRYGVDLPIDTDVVIWPETTYPALFGFPVSQVHRHSEKKMIDFVEKKQVSLIFGGYWRDNENLEHNSVFHLSPSLVLKNPDSDTGTVRGISLDRYDKTNLLLLGEYFFFEDWRPFKEVFPSIPNFGRGEGTKVFHLPMNKGGIAKATPILCYEILFPNYLRNAMADMPDFILNLTNDSWFGDYGEPQMHMAFASFRALELRLPLVRITNTGVTATVLQDGSQVDRIETGQQGIHQAVLPLVEFEPTLYQKGGHHFPAITLLVGLLTTVWLSLRQRNT